MLSEKYGIDYDDAMYYLEELCDKNIIKEIEIFVRKDAYTEYEEELEELTLLVEKLTNELNDIKSNYKLFKIESVADLIRYEDMLSIFNKKI